MGLTDCLQRPHASLHPICMQGTKLSHVRLVSGRRLHARRQHHVSQTKSRPSCDSRPGAPGPSRDPSLPSDVPKAKPPANFNPFKNTKKEASILPTSPCNITCLSASCWHVSCIYCCHYRMPSKCSYVALHMTVAFTGCCTSSTARHVQGQG